MIVVDSSESKDRGDKGGEVGQTAVTAGTRRQNDDKFLLSEVIQFSKNISLPKV